MAQMKNHFLKWSFTYVIFGSVMKGVSEVDDYEKIA